MGEELQTSHRNQQIELQTQSLKSTLHKNEAAMSLYALGKLQLAPVIFVASCDRHSLLKCPRPCPLFRHVMHAELEFYFFCILYPAQVLLWEKKMALVAYVWKQM